MTKKEELIHLILRMDPSKSRKALEQMTEDDLIFVKVRLSMQSGRPEPPQFSKGKTRNERAKNRARGRKKKR